MRILLVDDEEGIRTTLGANLELEGFTVAEAAGGKQALALLEGGGEYDVVLSDIRMPEMSGVQLFQAIKERWPHLPVVLSTAFSGEDVIRGALRNGAFAVLPKTLDVAQVVATLTRAASRPFVLIVDDHESRASAEAALLAIGVRVRTAPDGQAAIALIAKGEVDVCVVDLAGRGVDFIEQVRKLAGHIAVVGVSAHAAPALVQRAAAAGAYTCLQKPIDPGELVQIVAEARGQGHKRS